MKNNIMLSAALITALSGCATTGILPGSKTAAAKSTVTADARAEARHSAIKSAAKGCAIGAGMSVIGALLGGGFNTRAAIAGCVVAGAAGDSDVQPCKISGVAWRRSGYLCLCGHALDPTSSLSVAAVRP